MEKRNRTDPPWVTRDEEWLARVRAWVEKSTREQGIPLKVTDPATIRYIAAIFNGADPAKLRRPDRA